ncbi:MAG: hypothetical protein HKP61_16200 [Dactylosporangium sp.]|nr:hypothetical protein [Dactylosporangium sp.]NNJ62448.1 hypothetical protein [Dactylosporangium sp.]
MTTPVSGVGAVAPQTSLAGTRARTPDNGGVPDFGPAATFTATDFDSAAAIQMYNSSGNSIALTQWMRSESLPLPESVAPPTE